MPPQTLPGTSFTQLTDPQIAAKNAAADANNPLGSTPNPIYQQAQTYPVVTSQPAATQVQNMQQVMTPTPLQKTVKSNSYNSDGSTVVTYTDGTTAVIPAQNGSSNGSTPTNPNLTQFQTDTQNASQERSDAYDTYNSTISKIYGGDLSQAEQSQIDGIQKQYDSIKSLQEIANKSSQGIAAEFGNRLGLNVGSPLQSRGYIDLAINTGLSRIADIQSKADAAIAKMKQDFMKNDLSAANDSYTAYVKLKDSQQQATKDLYETQDKYESDLRDYNLQIQKQKNDDEQLALQKVKSDQDAQRLASDLSTDEVQRQKLYQDIAESKANIEKLGTELDPKVQTQVSKIANQFDNEQSVKDYNTVASQKGFIASLGDTPTDDQARIYAFAKVMDPNSAVREGEYNTVQKYSQALLQHYGLSAARIFTNDGFLTDEARKYIVGTIDKKEQQLKKGYDNVYNEYGRRINIQTGKSNGTDYITDYSKAFGSSEDAQTTDEKFQEAYSDPTKKSLIDQAMGAYPNYSTEDILSIVGIQ